MLIPEGDLSDVAQTTSDLLVSFFIGLAEGLGDEWDKPARGPKDKKNWVLTSTSMEVIMQGFVEYVAFLASDQSNSQLLSGVHESSELFKSFGEDIARAVKSKDYGFFSGQKDIRLAGNASARKEYFTDLIVFLRECFPNKYPPAFAAGVGFEDFTSLTISPKIKRRVEEIEFDLRRACIEALELEGPKKITKYLNSKYLDIIDRGLEQEKNWSDISLFSEEKKFEYLSLANLFEIMMKHFNKFDFTVRKSLLQERFRDIQLIRNAIAHPRDFPSHNAKRSWIASLDQVEEWFRRMHIKEEF